MVPWTPLSIPRVCDPEVWSCSRVAKLKIPWEHRLCAGSPLLASESCDVKSGIHSEEGAPRHLPLLKETIFFSFSGTRALTTVSSRTIRAIASCILTSLFTSSSPRCLGSCGTSFRKSPQRRFSPTPHPLGCLVSLYLGKDLSCLFLEEIRE